MANIITVSALNRYVKTLLERDCVLTDIALRGEISNFTNHFKTGHFYFSLRDEQCSVKAVMFRSYAQQLSFIPENGMRVIIRGRISLFERDGTFQVYVEDLFPDGIGAMQLAFDQLKRRLEEEGLFDLQHKKALPVMPQCIGLVTSKTGAAIQDILNVTRRRYPMAHFLLAPVSVQGNDAATEIASAIHQLDTSGQVDVIIVARGGGSKEDLWVFNDERIARAAYACKTPVVSAIGHEIDFCILDFVSDVRAPTPSAAAELVMPDVRAEWIRLYKIYTNICKEIQQKVRLCYNRLNEQTRASELNNVKTFPIRERKALLQKCDLLQKQMTFLQTHRTQKLAHYADLCHSLNPYEVLARGYAVVEKNDEIIKEANQLATGDRVQLRFQNGFVKCKVEQVFSKEEQYEKRNDI
ncbi:exodeoxyribonuclease VII large subunit [uncultured Ruthenibacterium sp.]|uniref:exodeoxyribonuclease VII large subunit n=1 Tax=uncultured Ruthenibacterium sp. TaxID=1905347 RepID=UPI00349E4A76